MNLNFCSYHKFIDTVLSEQGIKLPQPHEDEFLRWCDNEINRFGIGNVLPDLTIFIDVPPQVGLERVFNNIRKVD